MNHGESNPLCSECILELIINKNHYVAIGYGDEKIDKKQYITFFDESDNDVYAIICVPADINPQEIEEKWYEFKIDEENYDLGEFINRLSLKIPLEIIPLQEQIEKYAYSIKM